MKFKREVKMKLIFTLSILLLLQSTSLSKEISKKHSIDVDISLGGIYLQNGHPANESYLKTYGNEVTKVIEGDIEYTFKPKENIAARFELEADNNRAGTIRIKEAWFQLPMLNHTVVRFGNTQKDVGFKSSMGSFKRKFYDRSLLYRYIRSFDVLDYDIMLRTKIEHDINRINPSYIVALGADEDQRVFLNLLYELKIKNHTLRISDLYVNHVDTRFDKQNSNHLIFGYHHKNNGFNKNLEVFTGIDPDATNHLAYLGEDRTVHYFGSQLELSNLFKLKEKEKRITKGFEPAIQINWLSRDTENMGDGYLELRGAFNVMLNKPIKAKWHTGYGYVFQKSSSASQAFTEKNSTFISVVQISW